jgi:hypothetical protein
MDGVVTLIAAYADEDRRLTELVSGFPESLRDTCGRRHRLSLKQTIGHLAYWDDFAVDFYRARCSEENPEPLSFAEFEEQNRDLIEQLCAQDWETILSSYRRATRRLCAFLTERWDELDEGARDNFKIPLKHRRYHRRRLSELADELGLTAGGATMTEQAS